MTTLISDIYTPIYRKLIKEFPLRKITTKKDADAATRILGKHISESYADPGEEAYIGVLADLLGDYEDRYEQPVSTDSVTGLDALTFYMESNNLNQKDIAKLLGVSQGAISMIIKGEREITASHARKLGKRFNVNAGRFI